MEWSTRRKILYTLGTVVILIITLLYFFWNVIFPTPTCFDKKQNGYELGLDCGGVCSLRCTEEIIPLTVYWSRALETSSNLYDFVAMISNKNIDNTSRALGYSFIAYDDLGKEIAVVSGTTTASLGKDFPIIRQNIPLPKKPKEVKIKLFDTPHFSVKESPASPSVRSTNTRYEAGSIPRVYTTIINTKRIVIKDLPIVVVLYDKDNNAFAAGETFVEYLNKEEAKEISFTWNMPFNKVPSNIVIYPLFDAFLLH